MTPQALGPTTVALSGSHLVEASAGTGKTYAIATLYVRLLLEQKLRVSEILVVTYTNAATAELRLRVRRRLRETLTALDSGAWHDDEILDAFIRGRCAAGEEARRRDRAAVLGALHAFDEAAIFTIHGFCQRVLQENAFESGVPFETELLTNVTALVDEIVKDFWVGRLHDAPPALVRYLDGQGEGKKAPKKVTLGNLRRIAFEVVTHPGIEVLPSLETIAAGAAGEDPLAADVLRLQREFADYARAEMRRRKDAARLQSFDDLLQRLREALQGAGGEELAALVRERYRAALVDEFQDTDPVQYDIFRRIYEGRDVPLFLIGDPKQAIYGFRGADVFTYMEAKRQVATSHTLLVNRRSDPTLLQAINTVFERAAPAFLFEEIGYEPIEAAPQARDRLAGSRLGKPPFEVLFLPREGRDLTVNKPWMIKKDSAVAFATSAVAARVAALLAEGATLALDDGERPLLPSDIAVLTRKNQEAASMQEALRKLGVHAVLQTDASVFETPEAMAVDRTMRALVNPSDNLALRAALASSLIDMDAATLHALESDEAQWDEWARRFREWHDRWLTSGFVTAFRGLLDELEIEKEILRRVGGERQLTDVLHLVELLHRAASEQRLGPEALVQWLAQMRTDNTARAQLLGDAERVRLESDDAAVKLVTIHRSKGLEYPVVFCPFSWDGTLLMLDEKRTPRFHDPSSNFGLKLDLGSPSLKTHVEQAEYESLAENLRLLYVAFTRAKHYCGVVWGAVNQSQTSALAYLLFQDKTGGKGSVISRTRDRVKALSDAEMLADLRALAEASAGAVGVVELEDTGVPAIPRAEVTAASLQLPESRRPLYEVWRTSSFTGLTSAPLAALSVPDQEGIDYDVVVEEEAKRSAASTMAAERVVLPFAGLAGGARTGQFVHHVLESLDFMTDSAQLRQRLAEIVGRIASERASFDALVDGIAGVLDTPLGGAAGALRLRQVRRRLNELEFLLPVAPRLTVAALAAVFERHARTPVQQQYAQRLRQLGFPALEGYLRGFVDLVFEHEGKWYLADYKTNFLGLAVSDYAPAGLDTAMAAHHYPLQCYLYAVALHRYLGTRLAAYDYDEHFGGAYYLFLRGMSPQFPAGNGIWHERPARELIDDLAALFAVAEAAEPTVWSGA